MRGRIAIAAWIAFAAALAIWLGAGAGLFPWPRVAARSLAGLFFLVGVTRVAGDAGLVTQRRLRYAVAGVALTAASWFVAGSALVHDPALAVLGALHLGAAWLAAAPEQDAGERERGRLVLAATASAVSLLAIAALPAAAGVPGGPALPLALATATVAGAFYLARGRTFGLALTALAGVVTLVLAARMLADFGRLHAAGTLPLLPLFARTAPLLAATAALGAVSPVVALALRLPAIWRVLTPQASPGLRAALTWLTLPAVAAVAVVVLAPGW